MTSNITAPGWCKKCRNRMDEDGFSTNPGTWGSVSCDSCGYCYCDLSC